MRAPLLHLLAGQDDAGKSTYVRHALRPVHPLMPFISADEIAAATWPDAASEHSYGANRLADALRTDLMEARRSFITETVFSHPSKLDLIDDALRRGYLVQLHIVIVPLEVTLARAAFRVEHGGHTVPEEKICGRYSRLWSLVARARDRADQACILDNSSSTAPFRQAAAYGRGRLVGEAAWPTWAPLELRSPSTPPSPPERQGTVE